jgi:hypothetical protein
MSDYEYSGPRVPRTARNEFEVNQRFRYLVTGITDIRYREAINAWAASDEGAFPTRAQIEREVVAELETVCRGLDGWGAVNPDSVFPPEPLFFRLD